MQQEKKVSVVPPNKLIYKLWRSTKKLFVCPSATAMIGIFPV